MTRIRVATIGSSKIAESFLKGASHDPRFCHAAVYSRTPERGRQFAAAHGVEKVYTSLEELAASPDIDAVYIASPNLLHAPQAILMMDAGKSVLVLESQPAVGGNSVKSTGGMNAAKTE